MAWELIKFWLAKTGIECLISLVVVGLVFALYMWANKDEF